LVSWSTDFILARVSARFSTTVTVMAQVGMHCSARMKLFISPSLTNT